MTTHQPPQTLFRFTWKGLLHFILGWAACVILVAAFLAALVLLTSFYIWFTAVTTGQAYPTPDAALQAKIDQVFTGVQRYEIRAMAPNDVNGRQPGVWFVGADVWATGRTDGRTISERGYDGIGRFLVLTKRGWVFIQEAGWPPLWGSPAD